jgi:soluble lytic murein transglycosylase-like protein
MYDTLIIAAAQSHGLDPCVVKAIVRKESGFNTYAIRYEPAFLERYVPLNLNIFKSVDDMTERIQHATSWGLMQIMGAVARERGFTEPFCSALCDPAKGLDFGCRHLAVKKRKYPNGYDYIAAYNQGDNRKGLDGRSKNFGTYVAPILQWAKDYRDTGFGVTPTIVT